MRFYLEVVIGHVLRTGGVELCVWYEEMGIKFNLGVIFPAWRFSISV